MSQVFSNWRYVQAYITLKYNRYSTLSVLKYFSVQSRGAIILAAIFLRAKCYSLLFSRYGLSMKDMENFGHENIVDLLRTSKAKGMYVFRPLHIFTWLLFLQVSKNRLWRKPLVSVCICSAYLMESKYRRPTMR